MAWTLGASAALGLWVTFSPAMFGNNGSAANSDYVTGALVLTIAAVSTAEVIRAFRSPYLLAGVWLLIASWVIGGFKPLVRGTKPRQASS